MKTIQVYDPAMCCSTGICGTEVVERHANRTAWLPWQAEEPVGPAALARLGFTSLQTRSHER